MSLVSLLLFLVATARAACEPVDLDTLNTALKQSLAAFNAMNADNFGATHAEVEAALPCLAEPFTADAAAQYHRVAALAAYLTRSEAGTIGSFRAMQAIDPEWRLSAEIAPPGHQLERAFSQAQQLGPGNVAAIFAPSGYRVRIDGRATVQRPIERPALVQLVGRKNAVFFTRQLAPGEEAPDFKALVQSGPVLVGSRRRRVNLPLLSTAIAAATAAGGCYGAAAASRTRFDNPQTDFEKLAGLRTQTNVFMGAALVGGIGAIGLGTATLVVSLK